MAVDNLAAFNAAVAKAARQIPREAIVVFHKKIAFEVFQRTVDKTPVKTGRAQKGWNLTIGGSNDQETQNEAPISAALGTLSGLQPFQVIFINNAVPYIIFLEGGSSQRAPMGMLAVSLAEVTMLL